MKLLSVNVGTPHLYDWQGLSVRTSIFKSPVAGESAVSKLNIAGDAQSDLTVHGGVDKAVYVFPHEHYAYWEERGFAPLAMGSFGENLTTQGLLEDDIHIGDELELGSARFAVTQPRLPCSKLQVRFDRADMTKLFYQSRRFGFYLKVLREGTILAGQPILMVRRDRNAVSVADLIALYAGDEHDGDVLERVLRVEALSAAWREDLEERQARTREASA